MSMYKEEDCAIAKAVSRWLPTLEAWVQSQVMSYGIYGGQNGTAASFGFPSQFPFHQLLHTRHHLSSGTGTVGQVVADVPSGLSLTQPQEAKKKLIYEEK
jgi:hypothetical protein